MLLIDLSYSIVKNFFIKYMLKKGKYQFDFRKNLHLQNTYGLLEVNIFKIFTKKIKSISKISTTKRKSPKMFILDKNVILHDATSIRQFQENNVVIPLRWLKPPRFLGSIERQTSEVLVLCFMIYKCIYGVFLFPYGFNIFPARIEKD